MKIFHARHFTTITSPLICIIAAFAVSTSLWANDTVSQVDAGGLVIGTTNAISMDDELLQISPKKIQVRATFLNHTTQDITTTVAFPVPDVPFDTEEDVAIDPKSANPLHFTVRVNGHAQAVQLERTITKQQAPGGPFMQLRYYWTQIFPAGKSITIDHQYRPAVGGTILTADPFTPEDVATFCITPDFARSAKTMAAALLAKKAYGKVQWLGYILTSGANWRGPIGHWHLIIDKERPEDFVSLCIDGIKKTGPTRFEAEKSNLLPTKDLQLLFVSNRGWGE